MKMHIIGTTHSSQLWSDAIGRNERLDASPAVVMAFQDYLLDAVKKADARIIAEEMSQERIDELEGGRSVAKSLCERLKIAHIFCDPNRRQRVDWGASTNSLREECWLAQLSPYLNEAGALIFVCGANHVSSFGKLARAKGWDLNVYCDDWSSLDLAYPEHHQ